MEIRSYQTKAISAGVNSDNGVLVLPTGSGKSLVTAGLVNESEDGSLVLQPSIEILESNLEKARLFGLDPGVYSASAGVKQVGHVTYATIGSIIQCLDKFKHVKNLIIDEAHLVNPKGGMYESLIKELAPARLIGLTATPYRQQSSSWGTSMNIITRTKPKMFKKILHVTNPKELIEQGFLLMPKFVELGQDQSMLRINTAGSEFTESSVSSYSKKNNIRQRVVDLTLEVESQHNHMLVFAESVEDSKWIVEQLKEKGIAASEINANTNKTVRRNELIEYRNGGIKVMVNVGTLTTGYDFPALDCIIDGYPTMSAALHYQKIGREVRPYPGKSPTFYDLAGNVARLGNPLMYTMQLNITGRGYEVYGERGRVTTHMISKGPECELLLEFGKYRNKKLAQVDDGYLDWAVKEFKGDRMHMFHSEIVRRQLFNIQAEKIAA